MKKVLKKFNRTLSIMLAAAMVLTMVPQTAMPVLAANEGVEAMAETTPDDVVENEETTTPDDEESTDVADADDTENSGDSDATEGEDGDTEGDNETPVIDEGENADDSQAEETPDVEEEPVEDAENPAEDESPDSEEDASVDADADAETAKPAAPVITVKNGNSAVTDLTQALPNRAEGVTFEIAAVAGVTFKYTFGDTAPTKDTETTYSGAVSVTAPDQDAEGTVKINAIAVVTPEDGEAQVSDVKTVSVKFAAKEAAKKISLSEESEEATIEIGPAGGLQLLDADTPYEIVDPEERVYVRVTPKSSDTLYEVMYLGKGEGEKWTSAYTEKVDGQELYRIPNSRLGEDLQLKVVNMRKITLDWYTLGTGMGWHCVTISATAVREDSNYKGNLIVFGDQLEDVAYADKIYAPKDTKVELTVSPIAGQNVQLTKVALQKQGDAAATDQEITAGKSKFVVSEKIEDDYTLAIGGTSGYQETYLGYYESDMTDENGESLYVRVEPDKKGVYNLPLYKNGYELYARKGNEGRLEIAEVKVTENGKDSDAITATRSGEELTSSWTLNVKEEAGGKTLQIGMYANAEDKEPVDTLTVKVAPGITGVTIAGAKDNNGKKEITQKTGTEAKYALTPDNKLSGDSLRAYIEITNAEGEKVDGGVSNDCVSNVAVENGSLVVKTKTAVAAKKDAAEIVIKTVDGKKEVGRVTLHTEDPAWKSLSPTLKQAGATDTELILDITAPKGVVLPDYEDNVLFFYEVSVNKKGETKKDIKYVAATGQTTRFTFKVSDKELGQGEKANYEVTAKLVLYNSSSLDVDEDTKPEGTEIAASALSKVLSAATRDPYYADKITLKKEKAASALYTGQTAHVATVDFGKNASYNSGADVEIYDIPYGLTVFNSDGEEAYEEGSLTLSDDLKVYVHADSEFAKPGKYTIKARTTYNKESDNAGGSVVQATASLPITVVQGIYEIGADAPAKIYKTDKAATAKIAVTYNYGIKSDTPKTKKVTYDLVDYETEREVITVPGITVANNGTIKIDKSYQIKSTKEDSDANKYTVRVKAADYVDDADDAESERVAYVNFEVVGTPTALGKVALVKSVPGGYEDLAPSDKGNEIPVNEVDGAKVIVVKPNRDTVHGIYRTDDLVASELYTLTPAKGTVVDSDGDITVTKLGKNLVFKATATDGSKASVTSNKFTITYDASVEEATVTYTSQLDDSSRITLTKGGEDSLKNVPAGTVLTLNVVDQNDDVLLNRYGSWDANDNPVSYNGMFDYTLAVTNAKVVKKYDGGLALDVIMTKNPATVTLKKGKAEVGKYTIKIPALDSKELADATPKVSLKKGTKLYSNSSYYQELSFTMNKAVPGARYVKVSPQNNEDDTTTLYSALYSDETVLNANVKEFTFEAGLYDEQLKKGASFAFVFLDRDKNVITKTTNTVKIKTTALKKSYMLNAKYTMSTKDAYRVLLTGKSSGMADVTFDKLYNANIGGKINHFRDGFTLSDGNLVLQTYYDEEAKETKAVAEQWTSKQDKNNFTGFVEYTVTYEDDSEETFVTKIQVNLKTTKNGVVPAANKYAASAVSVLNPGAGKTTEGVSYVTTGKLPMDIRAARLVYSSGSGKNITYALDDENSPVQVKKISGNEITFTIKGSGRNETYNKAKLYVLPLTGMYAYDNNYMNWKVEEWRKYGVELKCNVSLKAANSKNKIKSPAKSVSFLNVYAEKLAVDGKGKMYYYAELPYTTGIFAQIKDKPENGTESIALTKTMTAKETKSGLPDFAGLTKDGVIKVRKVSNKNALGLYVDAEKFNLMVADNKAWSGAVFQNVAMTVPFVEAGASAETIKFSLTMPNPWSDISSSEAALARIISIVNGDSVNGIAGSSHDPATRTVTVTANNGNVEIENAINEQKEDIADRLLADSKVSLWVQKIGSITVQKPLDDGWSVGTTITNTGNSTEDNKAFLIKVVNVYVERLLKQMKEENISNPTWADLHGKEIQMQITATPKTEMAETKTEKCTVKFIVDEDAGNDLDRAIKRAVENMNGVIDPSITGEYNSGTKTVIIRGSNPELDFIDAKNQSRDKSVRILLSELGEYMDDVESLTFSYEKEADVRDSIEVRKEGRETSEQYIANLVDKWTDKLVEKLADGYDGDGDPNVFGRLGGKILYVDAKFNNKQDPLSYEIAFECEMPLTGLDAAINSAIDRLNSISSSPEPIPGIGGVAYNVATKEITIIGNDSEQDILESKDRGRDRVVRILLDEMDEYMSEVSEVTFTHGTGSVKDSITVKKENHESNETYISGLVDKWTDKVVSQLTKDDKPATYGSLDGETLEVTVKYQNPQKADRTYTISFEIQ